MPKLKKNSILSEPLKIIDAVIPADILPSEGFPWKHILPKIHKISQTFGFQRVEPSPVEALDFYRDGKHPESHLRLDTVNKKYGLRPQNFLSILRAYSANRVFERERITKWYYVEPVFALDKSTLYPVYEYGLVNFGEPTSMSDAQIIMTIKVLMEELGLSTVVFEVNNKGCNGCAPYYQEVLGRFLEDNKEQFCESCQNLTAHLGKRATAVESETMTEVFTCAEESCKAVLEGAPQIIDYLDVACHKQLTSLLEALDELEVSYQLNPRLFGGNWLSHTVFRVKFNSAPEHGGQEVIFGVGGRHNRFVSKLIGQEIPSLVFSIPLSTLAEMVDLHAQVGRVERGPNVFLISIGDLASKKSLKLFMDLWKNNITVTEQFGEIGIKNQFKIAEKRGCSLALIIGQKEALEDSVILRDVRSSIQEVFSYDRIIEEVKKRLQD